MAYSYLFRIQDVYHGSQDVQGYNAVGIRLEEGKKELTPKLEE